MAVAALVLIGVWLLVAVGARTVVQLRRVGNTEIRVRDRPGTAQWWAKMISTVGFLGIVAAPIAELLGLEPFPVLDAQPIRGTGAALAVAGIALTFVSQLSMGASWRADVDPDVRTALVTTGPFRWVRNPVLTGVGATCSGVALLVPNAVALGGLVFALAAIEIQVRQVEEPYLRSAHGAAYAEYAAHTGRFLPLLGRQR
ncbi:methyltransferase family protein [Nocardia brasiliensis]|uniref:methyltransferase family protein n=1 Tax=Nocardia brasiliensis TaxID=37326 RepID=UPI00367222EE